jgi:hypothetical protein
MCPRRALVGLPANGLSARTAIRRLASRPLRLLPGCSRHAATLGRGCRGRTRSPRGPLPEPVVLSCRSAPVGRYALTGSHRDSPTSLPPGPRSRVGCDYRDQHELDPRSARLTFSPSRHRIPAGTTASADFCQVSRSLPTATVTSLVTPRQTSPDKSNHFPSTPAAFT